MEENIGPVWLLGQMVIGCGAMRTFNELCTDSLFYERNVAPKPQQLRIMYISKNVYFRTPVFFVASVWAVGALLYIFKISVTIGERSRGR